MHRHIFKTIHLILFPLIFHTLSVCLPVCIFGQKHTAVSKLVPALETPDQIAKWREARRKYAVLLCEMAACLAASFPLLKL